jgi:bacterioferritin-associated ferredoxin
MFICYCEGLTESEIEDIILKNNILCIEKLKQNCGAGLCCKSCVIDLHEILTKMKIEKEKIKTNE